MLAALLAIHAAAGAAPGETGSAADGCAGPSSDDCVAVRHWSFSVALGAGVRTNPLVNGENIPLVIIPHVSYYGERFFLDDLDLGVTLVESAANSLSLIASPGYDRVYFYRPICRIFSSPVIWPTVPPWPPRARPARPR